MEVHAEKLRNWATARFAGMAGDPRLVRRTVSVAEQLARRPAGVVTQVFDVAKEREGAYRLLENERVTYEALETSLGRATARACAWHREVLVPVDGSSLNLVDNRRNKGFGVIGSFRVGARGIIVQSALATEMDGTPIDIAGQRYWVRTTKRAKGERATENTHPIALVGTVLERMAESAPDTTPWFQFDRGYDAQEILRALDDMGAQYTVRSSANRRVEDVDGQRRYLGDVLSEAPILGEYSVALTANAKRPARIARVSVRATKVTLFMRRKSKSLERLELFAIEAREHGQDGLHWRLLTSKPADTFERAMQVVRAYESRWRIEEFHRAWKDGCGRVEDTQLRSFEAVTKWSTLHATVAARATRLAHLARSSPDLPASTEFSRAEIRAMSSLTKRPKRSPTDPEPTLAEAVDMCARLGGYIGKSSGGPPGATVIARGLQRVVDVAEALKDLLDGSG